jgi:hypothetical protein
MLFHVIGLQATLQFIVNLIFMPAQECAGEGFQCYLSRSGIYALLVILMSLCNLTHHISSKLSGSRYNEKKKRMLDISCFFFPAFLCSVSYILDILTKNDQDVENGSNLLSNPIVFAL